MWPAAGCFIFQMLLLKIVNNDVFLAVNSKPTHFGGVYLVIFNLLQDPILTTPPHKMCKILPEVFKFN